MEAEAAKGRMEAELLQVSKIATGMEARLRDAQAAADSARTAAATADRRAYEVGAAALISCRPSLLAAKAYQQLSQQQLALLCGVSTGTSAALMTRTLMTS